MWSVFDGQPHGSQIFKIFGTNDFLIAEMYITCPFLYIIAEAYLMYECERKNNELLLKKSNKIDNIQMIVNNL